MRCLPTARSPDAPAPRLGWPAVAVRQVASGVGARLHTRSAPLGAVPGRFFRGLVRCSACSRAPVIRGGGVFSPRPQGGVIAMEVCLAGHPEGFPCRVSCRLCMVASWLKVAAWGSRRWGRLGGRSCGTP